jgi:hypothetical protein
MGKNDHDTQLRPVNRSHLERIRGAYFMPFYCEITCLSAYRACLRGGGEWTNACDWELDGCFSRCDAV